MSREKRKAKKEAEKRLSTRQFIGAKEITDYSLVTYGQGELVYFIVKPTNISVLSESSVGARIYALMTVLKGVAEIEMLCLNSRESFEDNKRFLKSQMEQEENPVIRHLLEQDQTHLDRIQVQMATAREFLIMLRLKDEKESDIFPYLSRIEKSLNLHSVFQKGTVEFRLFNGTLHAGKIKAYIQFCLAIGAQALNQSCASRRKTQTSNEKYTFRTWLLRLGLNGEEFATARQHLLANLPGCIAWKDPAQAEAQKERMRQKREKELAERIQRQETIHPIEELESAGEAQESPAFCMRM